MEGKIDLILEYILAREEWERVCKEYERHEYAFYSSNNFNSNKAFVNPKLEDLGRAWGEKNNILIEIEGACNV